MNIGLALLSSRFVKVFNVDIIKRMSSSFKEGLSRVELHCHIDGSCRAKTIWEIAKRRGMLDRLPGNTVEDFTSELNINGSGSLTKFIKSFGIYMPVINGDREGIKRIVTELCEDKMQEGVAYFEASYCPHLLSDDNLTTEEVVQIVNEGFKEGQEKYGVQGRCIVCIMRENPESCKEAVELCNKYRNDGVVGIGMAGDESVPLQEEIYKGMQEAIKLNIKRSIHAGESGPASNVKEAIEVFQAQRIGHGYHSLDDDQVYELVKKSNVHLEVCPTSSMMLGNVSTDWTKHPAVRFAKDNLNFSLNTDDSLHFRNTLQTEEDIALKYFGISEDDLIRLRVCAANSSFLPEKEKISLIEHVMRFRQNSQ